MEYEVERCTNPNLPFFVSCFAFQLRNATVEHQMIANGVFGALNDAYNVFKPA